VTPEQWTAQERAHEEEMRRWAWEDWDRATNHPSRFWWLRRAWAWRPSSSAWPTSRVRTHLDPALARLLEGILRTFAIEESAGIRVGGLVRDGVHY
jgi:hypothetical protein